MDEEYNFYDEDINKINWLKIIIFIILIIGIVVGYFLFNNMNNKKDTVKNDQTISVTDSQIQSLYNRYNIFINRVSEQEMRISGNIYGYYYNLEKYNNQTISPEIMILTAINELYMNKTLKYSEYSEEPLNISGKKVRDTIKELFGNDVKFSDTSIDNNLAAFCNLGSILYDNDQDLYYTLGSASCVTSNEPFIKTRLVEATKDKNKITIVDEMAYFVPNKTTENGLQYNVYDSMETNDLTYVDTINTLTDFAFYNYKHLHRYRYTFKKNDQGYIFESVERIK